MEKESSKHIGIGIDNWPRLSDYPFTPPQMRHTSKHLSGIMGTMLNACYTLGELKMAKVETVIETVTMEDARIVEFAGKRKLLKTSKVSAEGKVSVTLDFRNGQTRTFTIPDNLVAKFAAHGAEQKLGDEIAGLEDIDDCVMATDELIDRLYNGEWGIKREANGMAGTSVLARALVELTGKTRDQIKTFLSAKTQAEKVALRNSAKVKPIVERLEAEKASKGSKVDTDALLGELG